MNNRHYIIRTSIVEKVGSSRVIWRFNQKCATVSAGKTLRLEVLQPAIIHWSFDAWQTAHDTKTTDTSLGVHIADLPTEKISKGNRIDFTFYWPLQNRWENIDFAVIAE